MPVGTWAGPPTSPAASPSTWTSRRAARRVSTSRAIAARPWSVPRSAVGAPSSSCSSIRAAIAGSNGACIIGIIPASAFSAGRSTPCRLLMPAWRDPAERFWSKVDPDGPVPPGHPDLGPCWVWTGCIGRDGYGRFNAGQRTTIRAHIWAYRRYIGPVPARLTLDHLCRNRRCVRPDHLEPVTRGTNVLRGESVFAQHARQTHCIHGHPFDSTNTYRDQRGRRACRECKRAKDRRRSRLRRAAV